MFRSKGRDYLIVVQYLSPPQCTLTIGLCDWCGKGTVCPTWDTSSHSGWRPLIYGPRMSSTSHPHVTVSPTAVKIAKWLLKMCQDHTGTVKMEKHSNCWHGVKSKAEAMFKEK